LHNSYPRTLQGKQGYPHLTYDETKARNPWSLYMITHNWPIHLVHLIVGGEPESCTEKSQNAQGKVLFCSSGAVSQTEQGSTVPERDAAAGMGDRFVSHSAEGYPGQMTSPPRCSL
jgi:hypothetical protein